MDKRYQVFVSSTYVDLKEERQKVIQTIMEADCIPSGMELFPAADEEQFIFIKKIIDDCDYYLLIIGGRYGSTTSEGISFTEKEYDYAIEKGLKVIAFVHEDPESLGEGKFETDVTLRERLNTFRDKVSSGRVAKRWSSPNDLPGLVALSLQKTIKTFPAVGWIRADRATNVETLTELNSARKEIDSLKTEIKTLKSSLAPNLSGLASLDESFMVSVKSSYFIPNTYPHRYGDNSWVESYTWREIFSLIAPHLLNPPADLAAKGLLEKCLAEERNKPKGTLLDKDFQTIKIQLQALGLIDVSYSETVGGGMNLFWQLTPKGHSLMFETRAVRTLPPHLQL